MWSFVSRNRLINNFPPPPSLSVPGAPTPCLHYCHYGVLSEEEEEEGIAIFFPNKGRLKPNSCLDVVVVIAQKSSGLVDALGRIMLTLGASMGKKCKKKDTSTLSVFLSYFFYS